MSKTTRDWIDLATKDLKGKDPSALNWETPEGITVRPLYTADDLPQGAAAELFKMWAVTVRARGGEMGMEVVLCLHDELLLHVPLDRADDAVALTRDCLAEAAHRWHPTSGVRFVADISVVRSWADAKG